MVRALGALVVVVCLAGGATAAPKTPQDEAKEKAKAEYLEAMKSYNLGEYPQALDHFKEAYRAYQEPSFLFNIGQTQRQMGQKAEAVRSYRAYLRTAKSNRAEVEQIIASLEKALAEEQTAKNKTPVDMMGPNGEAPPKDPTPTVVAKVEPTPKPEPKAEPAPKTEPAPKAEPAPKTEPAVVTANHDDTAPKPLYKKGWFWGVVVGAVVLVGVGVGVGLAVGSSKTTYPKSGPADGTFHF